MAPRVAYLKDSGALCFYPLDGLPDLCFKCATPHTGRITKRFRFLVRSLPGRARVESCTLELPICARCLARESWAPLVGLGVWPLAFALLVLAVLLGLPSLATVALLLAAVILGALAHAKAKSWVLQLKGVDGGGMVELHGVHRTVCAEITAR